MVQWAALAKAEGGGGGKDGLSGGGGHVLAVSDIVRFTSGCMSSIAHSSRKVWWDPKISLAGGDKQRNHCGIPEHDESRATGDKGCNSARHPGESPSFPMPGMSNALSSYGWRCQPIPPW